jgi:hypothetical protein
VGNVQKSVGIPDRSRQKLPAEVSKRNQHADFHSGHDRTSPEKAVALQRLESVQSLKSLVYLLKKFAALVLNRGMTPPG